MLLNIDPETGKTDIRLEANPQDKATLRLLDYKDAKIPDAMIYFDSNWVQERYDFIEKL